MKIAYVTHYGKLYGANRSLLCLMDGLKDHSVQPYVIAPKQGPITEELSKRDIPFYTAPFKRWMSVDRWKVPARLGMNLGVLPLLVRKAHEWEVDLVHTNSSVTPIGALVAEVLSLPHTWHVREFGKRDFGLQYDWGKRLFQKVMSRADATIAVSEAVKRHVLSDVDVPSHVVYNGVIAQNRLEKLGKVAKAGDDHFSGQYTFAIVGQISPAKGQEQALRAMSRLIQEERPSRIRLLVAGSGTEKRVEFLRQLRKSLALEKNVTFLGYVSDPFEVYQQADAVLMCSPNEAMGRVTAEAMAAARPVIGYDNDGTAELIDDEHNGLLYDGTTEHLAHCMGRFVSKPGWAKSLGRNGWGKAKKEFTNEVYARRVYDVISNVL
jgi:glycosyltransferase involved in cell wall biosynthesis